MSGRKQHHIPKSLLRYFAANERGQHGQVFVFTKAKDPFLCSIGDVAAERDFYSEVGSGDAETLDDRITEYETRLASLLQQMAAVAPGEKLSASVAAEAIAHLSVRAGYIRDIFTTGTSNFLREASEHLSDKAKARSIFLSGDHLTQAVDGALQNISPLIPKEVPEPLLRRMLLGAARENFDNLFAEVSPKIQEMVSRFLSEMPNAMRSGHARVFEHSMFPDSREAALLELKWNLIEWPTPGLVLPDCVAISLDVGTGSAKPFIFSSSTEDVALLVPLTPRKLLVATSSGQLEFLADVDFNSLAASCSARFFISCEDTESLRALADEIGKNSHGPMNSIVADAVARHFHPSASSLRQTQLTSPQEHASSYEVRFSGCATQEQAEAIAAVVRDLVAAVATNIDLSNLLRIVFAGDYAQAVLDVELELGLSSVSPSNDNRLEGVAASYSSEIEGQHVLIVVVSAWIGHLLISCDKGDFQRGGHILVSALAQAAFTGAVRKSLQPESSGTSIWDAILFRPMSGVPAGYFSAWTSAVMNPDAETAHREVVTTLLERANATIAQERLFYETHNDLDRFLDLATKEIGNFLVATAKLIGHCHAIDAAVYKKDDALHLALHAYGLLDWIALFGDDLRMLFTGSGMWHSLSELSALSSHMERHLWRFFVFPWPLADGQVWIEVPHFGRLVNGKLGVPPND